MRKTLITATLLSTLITTNCEAGKPNRNVTAHAGQDQVIDEFSVVILNGCASVGKITGYTWVQNSGEPVVIYNDSECEATFIAPDVELDTILSFKLTVAGQKKNIKDFDFVDITVKAFELPPLPTVGEALLTWLAPTENTDGSALTDLAGFNIYYSTDQNNLNNIVYVTENDTAVVIKNLDVEELYYFGISAINTLGVESELSNVVSKIIL